MDYQALLAALPGAFSLAAVFATLCYTPLPMKNDWAGQLAKWLRMVGMVCASGCEIQITSLTGPGLWTVIHHHQAVS
jgi:hypothetical protein